MLYMCVMYICIYMCTYVYILAYKNMVYTFIFSST